MIVKEYTSKVFKEIKLSMFNTSANKYFEPLVNYFLPKQSLTRKLAKVIRQKNELDDVITLTLQPSKKWKGFIAGQFIELTFEINGVRYKRFFSISSRELLYKQKGQIEVTIKKQFKGKVTEWLFNQNIVNSRITISDAMGVFVLEQTSTKPILLIAGGSGITPIKSMLESYTGDSKLITLVYYGKTNQHLFQNKLTEICNQKGITLHFIDTNIEGRITAQQADKYCPDFTNSNIYICGPIGMIEKVKDLGLHYNITPESIKEELFHPIRFDMNNNIKKEGFVSINNQSKLKILSDGTTSILDLIESNNLNINSGCRMGICHQCICEKTSGVVLNKKNNTLSDTSKEMIQTCISIPVGDVYLNL